MPHLAQFRTGWENENFAQFILSRFSFVARPVTVGDDVGSDFFCTLFQKVNGRYLMPKTSYAIQIKSHRDVASKKNRIDMTGKIDYLKGLEIPFFIGVANNHNNTLAIYSGELIPRFFSYKGSPSELTAVLGDRRKWEEQRPENDEWDIDFPLVAKLGVETKEDELGQFVEDFLELCLLMRTNLSTRTSKRYFFRTPLPNGEMDIRLYAGKDSAQTFRANFFESLTEVFNNLDWIMTSYPESFQIEEFVAYERLYLDLKESGQDIPRHLQQIYSKARSNVEALNTT